VLSIRFGVILRSEAIAIPRLGVLNLHSGLLPEYRGVMATFYALLNGAKRIGTTVHFIRDRGIDTGPILGRTTLEVEPGRSYLHHVLNLYPEGCALLAQTAQRLLAGESVEGMPQGGSGAYYTFPTTEELVCFHAAGHRLFDGDELLAFTQRYVG
jgi:methionyl-tRNA formyltransferase